MPSTEKKVVNGWKTSDNERQMTQSDGNESDLSD